jgi:hypothetical protein
MLSSPNFEEQRGLRDFIADIKRRIRYVKQSPEYESNQTIGVAIALLESIIAELERDVRSRT